MYRQIADTIAESIMNLVLPAQAKLPPERELAALLGVSRTTAINAYCRLEQQGLVVIKAGSGTYVAELHAKQDNEGSGVPWVQLMTPVPQVPLFTLLREILNVSITGGSISLAAGMPDPALYPIGFVQQAVTASGRGINPADLGHIGTEGYGPLRRLIAEMLGVRGISTDSDQVMITAGSQQGLYLVSKALLEPGDYVVVESPTFIGAHQVFRASGARILGLPSARPFPFALLEDYLVRYRPKLLYLIPTYHNPTGWVMPEAERRELLRLAARHRLVVLEDDPYSDLCYGDKPPDSLKAMDVYGGVVYLSTFSKVLFPGLRTGYVAAHPALLNRMALEKQFIDLHTNNLAQWLLCRLLENGFLQSHLALVRGEYKKRRDVLAKALRRHCGDALSFEMPQGGFYLWCRLNRPVSANRLLHQATGEGLSFVPGEAFYAYPPEGEKELRLCFATHTEDRMQEAAHRLARALDGVEKASKKQETPASCPVKPII
jgi:DNA-binding transcriptional MocR family regulator